MRQLINENMRAEFICHEHGNYNRKFMLSTSSKYSLKFGTMYKKIDNFKTQFIYEDFKAQFISKKRSSDTNYQLKFISVQL